MRRAKRKHLLTAPFPSPSLPVPSVAVSIRCLVCCGAIFSPSSPSSLQTCFVQQVLQQVKVEYEVLAGWDEDISECKEWDDLPTNAQVYVRRVEVRIWGLSFLLRIGADSELETTPVLPASLDCVARLG